jgi:hypothetical protein
MVGITVVLVARTNIAPSASRTAASRQMGHSDVRPGGFSGLGLFTYKGSMQSF